MVLAFSDPDTPRGDVPNVRTESKRMGTVEVTRVELAEHLIGVFVGGAAHRDDLVEAAAASGARPEVMAVLRALPERRFKEFRDLWPEMPSLPVGA